MSYISIYGDRHGACYGYAIIACTSFASFQARFPFAWRLHACHWNHCHCPTFLPVYKVQIRVRSFLLVRLDMIVDRFLTSSNLIPIYKNNLHLYVKSRKTWIRSILCETWYKQKLFFDHKKKKQFLSRQ